MAPYPGTIAIYADLDDEVLRRSPENDPDLDNANSTGLADRRINGRDRRGEPRRQSLIFTS